MFYHVLKRRTRENRGNEGSIRSKGFSMRQWLTACKHVILFFCPKITAQPIPQMNSLINSITCQEKFRLSRKKNVPCKQIQKFPLKLVFNKNANKTITFGCSADSIYVMSCWIAPPKVNSHWFKFPHTVAVR